MNRQELIKSSSGKCGSYFIGLLHNNDVVLQVQSAKNLKYASHQMCIAA